MVNICEYCKAPFTIAKYKQKRFCNRACWLRSYNTVGAEHAIRGAIAAGPVLIAKLRGTGTKTYVKENQRHQHRVVAERLLDRPLTSTEIVHHEDRNKKNNDPRNLIVFPSQAEHARHHMHGLEGTCHCSIIKRWM